MKTSVLPELGFTPGACQNSELVVGSGSITTSHLRLPRACITRFESGPMLVAVIPLRIRPAILPWSAWSKMLIHDEFLAGLRMKLKANSFDLVAASPYEALSAHT